MTGRGRLDPRVRFWAKVDRPEWDVCWNWTGSRNSAGYGLFASNTHPVRLSLAHRWVLEDANGEKIPRDRVVMHLCDNRSCVNPLHLRIATVAENNQDMFDKGRHPKSKLAQARALGEAAAAGLLTLAQAQRRARALGRQA